VNSSDITIIIIDLQVGSIGQVLVDIIAAATPQIIIAVPHLTVRIC
jgi:hypothetical protein